jgi:hypothetical protein
MIFHAGLVPGSSSWEAALDVYDWCEASAADADLVPVGYNPGDLEVRLERMNYSVNMKEFQAWMLYHEQWRGSREAESRAWAVDAVSRSGLEDRIKWLDQIE